MARPLEGIKVIDLTNVIAGPLASYYLVLMGAEVVKVENPDTGDLSRKMGADSALGRRKMGVSFMAMNGGKKSITLNLKSERGKALFLDLVAKADVVVENYRPGTMKRLGLDYEVLRAVNPKLVYCAVSGFGQTGPLADRPSYDQIIQGFCGLMSITGDAEGDPTRAGYVVCDSAAAITAAFGIVAALIGRDRTGQGEMIDVSMLDTALTTMASWNVSNFLNAATGSIRMGNQSQSACPSGTFRTADGLINIVNNEQQQFVRLCHAIGRAELLTDPRFSDLHIRFQHRDEMQVILDEHLSAHPTAHWEAILTAASVPVGPVLSIEDAVAHPQIGRARPGADLRRRARRRPRDVGAADRFPFFRWAGRAANAAAAAWRAHHRDSRSAGLCRRRRRSASRRWRDLTDPGTEQTTCTLVRRPT